MQEQFDCYDMQYGERGSRTVFSFKKVLSDVEKQRWMAEHMSIASSMWRIESVTQLCAHVRSQSA